MSAPIIRETTLSPKKKECTISPESVRDIGTFINSLKIQRYDEIIVTIKAGTYIWDDCVTLPNSSNLKLAAEKYGDGGRENNVSVIMSMKHTHEFYGKDYANNSRLIIMRDATAEIYGINIKEIINDSRERSPVPEYKSVFSLREDNARFFLFQGEFEISASPFINICHYIFGRVLFGHSHFTRIGGVGSTPIQIVSNEKGGFGGSKGLISCSHSTIGPGCALGGEDLEIIRYAMH